MEVTEIGGGRKTFDGDAKHPPLYERESLAFLPFQKAPDAFVIPVYVATYDVNNPMPETTYRLMIRGLGFAPGRVGCDDPLDGRAVTVKVLKKGADLLEIEVPVADHPRLLTLAR